MNVTGEEYATAARSWVNVPFRHWGRNRHGVDCVGLVLCVAYDLGLSSYTPRPYSRNIDPAAMRAELEVCLDPVEEKQPGDVLFMRVYGVPQHLGIYTGETLIHAFETVGKVCEVQWSPYWFDKVESVWRWKGLG